MQRMMGCWFTFIICKPYEAFYWPPITVAYYMYHNVCVECYVDFCFCISHRFPFIEPPSLSSIEVSISFLKEQVHAMYCYVYMV